MIEENYLSHKSHLLNYIQTRFKALLFFFFAHIKMANALHLRETTINAK